MKNKANNSQVKNLKRLQVVMARAGIASRREAERMIEEGRVELDGKTVKEKGLRVDPSKSRIRVDGREISCEEKKFYFLFNKPAGVTSTVRDRHAQEKVTDYFKGVKARLYPVGRLDKDSTGLLILTNDGDLAFRLSHPAFQVEKEYVAVLNANLGRDEIVKLEKGVRIYGEKTAPCRITPLSARRDCRVFSIVLHEGKKRQVRRMFEHVNKKVRSLKRTRYMFLDLAGLPPGGFRKLHPQEVERLKRSLTDKR